MTEASSVAANAVSEVHDVGIPDMRQQANHTVHSYGVCEIAAEITPWIPRMSQRTFPAAGS